MPREKDHKIRIDTGIDTLCVDEPAVHPEKFVSPALAAAGPGIIREALFDMVPDITSRNILTGVDQRYLHG